jgi:hypothetical protein
MKPSGLILDLAQNKRPRFLCYLSEIPPKQSPSLFSDTFPFTLRIYLCTSEYLAFRLARVQPP